MQLAQINIAVIKYALEDPRMAGFVDNLDRINALAEASDGYIWRLQDDAGNATSILAFENPHLLLNMSVWRDVESLKSFTYQTAHSEYLGLRKQWFEIPNVPHLALWWIEDGEYPTPQEGRRRVELLQSNGPTSDAFTFKKAYSPGE
jgi:hypothetical protein